MEHQGWNLEDNYSLSTNTRSIRPQDELVELLWRDGQVILQSQTHREQTQAQAQAQSQTQKQNLHQENLSSNIFLEEQETISWIQYPPDEDPFETDFFSTVAAHLERPTSETTKHEAGPDPSQIMLPPKFRLTDSSSSGGIKELGKEQYSVMMTVGPSHCASNQSQIELDTSMNSLDRSKTIGEKLYPKNTTSSSGGSSGCSLGQNMKEMAKDKSNTTDRKRKHIMDNDESVSHSDANELNKRSDSTRRSRAAEVHNLSERRRRDRINERMKTLQELIPHCSKTDKASILDEAIDYLKSLQLQLQVMWMGSGMTAAPMMFPGVHPPPFIRQMQSPVHFPRFPVMDNRSVIQNNPGLVNQNPVQNQVFSDRFGRYFGRFPQMPAGSQSVEMLRFGSPAEQGGQQPSAPSKTTDDPPMGH